MKVEGNNERSKIMRESGGNNEWKRGKMMRERGMQKWEKEEGDNLEVRESED